MAMAFDLCTRYDKNKNVTGTYIPDEMMFTMGFPYLRNDERMMINDEMMNILKRSGNSLTVY